MTPAPDLCPTCRTPLGPRGPREEAASCPRCLLAVALESAAQEPEVPRNSAPGEPGSAAPAPEELAPFFPQLALEARIGSGGMGHVYRAQHRGLGRAVALKVLDERFGADPMFAERFEREARALARLAHPNIVGVHDAGRAAGLCYLVMEHVDGTTLRDVLEARKRGDLEALAPQGALAIVRQICAALEYAHTQGVVHRDIKPENVLLDRAGTVKIADFGLAKLTGAENAGAPALTRATQAMGTPHYMAPEQLERPLEVDHRADIYSLGVVFYELLTGELPLGRFEPPSRRAQCDAGLDDIVLRTLEKEPARRYQRASEVTTDLDANQAGGGLARAPVEGAPAASAPVLDLARGAVVTLPLYAAGLLLLAAAFGLLIGLPHLRASNNEGRAPVLELLALGFGFQVACLALVSLHRRLPRGLMWTGGLLLFLGPLGLLLSAPREALLSWAGAAPGPLGGRPWILLLTLLLLWNGTSVWTHWRARHLARATLRPILAPLTQRILATFVVAALMQLLHSSDSKELRNVGYVVLSLAIALLWWGPSTAAGREP